MKNIFFRYCFFVFIAFSFFACQKSKKTEVSHEVIENTDSVEESNILNNDIASNHEEKVVLEFFPKEFVKGDTVKKTEYRVYNHSNSIIKFSSQFSVEKLIDNEWRDIPLNELLGFEDILYALEPDTYLGIPVSFSVVLQDKAAESGEYRIVKEVWKSNKEHDKISCIAEFVVID